MNKLRLLIKFPTRGRPHQFVTALNRCFHLASDKENIQFLVSYDTNDPYMNGKILDLAEYPNLQMVAGISKNKIDACNRDIEKAQPWDIVLLLSDDMICQQKGWDEILRSEFGEDLDQCIHHNDGYTGDTLQTMVIYGRTYYERFGYLYHPDFISLWADNMQMEVAKRLRKYKYFDQVLFKHQHYANDRSVPMDAQYKQTEKYYHTDKLTFERHQANNFGL